MAKKRKMEEVEQDEPELYKLLNINPYNDADRQRIDCDAIIKAAQQDPQSVEIMYAFPFPFYDYPRHFAFPIYQAIHLGAPIDVIKVLCTPMTLSGSIGCGKGTALYVALEKGVSLDVVEFLLEKQPEALWERNNDGNTTLHIACGFRSQYNVVSLLLERWPGASKEKNYHGNTPLHTACSSEAPSEVVSLLLDSWPGAAREKNAYDHMPLHRACELGASLEVVALLHDSWSDAIKYKCDGGFTPLLLACCNKVQFEIILFLLDQWPEAIMQKDNNGDTPFDYADYNERATETTKALLSHVSAIFDGAMDNTSPNDIMSFFMGIMWSKGVRLLLDRHPVVTKTIKLHTNLMPDFLSMIGHHCSLTTMWEMIRNEQNLLADV